MESSTERAAAASPSVAVHGLDGLVNGALSEAGPSSKPPPALSPESTINPLGLEVRIIEGRGRGVFARGEIRAGTVLEEAPVLVLTRDEWARGMDDTVLGEYGFCWSQGGMAIGLGIASLFNHSSTPNVNFIRNPSAGTIRFSASRAVSAGDELCICYTADESKLWFLPQGGSVGSTASASGATLIDSDDEDGTGALAVLSLDADDLGDQRRRRTREERRAAGVAATSSSASPFAGPSRDSVGSTSAEPGPEQELTTRRDKGGSTHSAREKRRAKYRAKMEARDVGAVDREVEIVQPRPVLAATLGAGVTAAGGFAVTAGGSTPNPVSKARAGAGPTADLPPPLHSGARRHTEDVELAPELDWTDPGAGEVAEAQWGVLQRAKGPVEIEEAAEDDDDATISVWAVDVVGPNLMRDLLGFTKHGTAADPRMRHLKRVRRVNDASGEHVYVALAMTDLVSCADLQKQLAAFAPDLASLEPKAVDVPQAAARTPAQLTARNTLWPVLFSPGPPRVSDARGMPGAKLAWIAAGIARVLSLAREAKSHGELPVACYVSSPPDAWPPPDGFIPPTPGLRAAASDTRTSQSHPLRHAALNCIARVARLRTVPPFSDMQPTRNGADYLLTSMTLFATHEPCVMCAMALLHSRVREVYFVFPRQRAGGFEGSYGVHSRRDLNHRFEAWRWCGEVAEGEGEFGVDESVEI